MAYLDRQQMQARGFSPLDVMNALDEANVFLPSGDGKFGKLDYVLDSNSMYENIRDMGEIPLRYENGRTVYLRDVATPTDANYIQTNVVRVNGKREVYIPVYRQLGSSTLGVVSKLSQCPAREWKRRLTKAGISLEARHGPVGLCAKVDRGARPGRSAGGDPLFAGDPALPG